MELSEHLKVLGPNIVGGTWDDVKDLVKDLPEMEVLWPEQYGLPSEKPKKKKFVNYHKHLKSDVWKRICKAKLKSVGYKCELCGSAMNLEVHHITYDRLGNENLDDLLVVCHKCHTKLHEEDLKRKGGH